MIRSIDPREDLSGDEAPLTFTVAAGVPDLILAAIHDREDTGFTCLLRGDLAQMAAQKQFLLDKGFEVGQQDVYPAVRPEDFTQALRLIFENRVAGWWNFKSDFLDQKVCSIEQFQAAFEEEI